MYSLSQVADGSQDANLAVAPLRQKSNLLLRSASLDVPALLLHGACLSPLSYFIRCHSTTSSQSAVLEPIQLDIGSILTPRKKRSVADILTGQVEGNLRI